MKCASEVARLREISIQTQTQTQAQTQIQIFNQDCRNVGQVYLSRLRSWKKNHKNGDGDGDRKQTEKRKESDKGKKGSPKIGKKTG